MLGRAAPLDETYVKVAGRWISLYRAVDQHGQVIDVLISRRRHAVASWRSEQSAARAIERGVGVRRAHLSSTQQRPHTFPLRLRGARHTASTVDSPITLPLGLGFSDRVCHARSRVERDAPGYGRRVQWVITATKTG
jgi:hypothetical protein